MTTRNTEPTAAPPRQRANERNQSIECVRLLGAISVIFIHSDFPGVFGEVMNCLARFAVPFFFVISGYFAYQAKEPTIQKRIRSIFELNVYATLFYLLWGLFQERYIHGQGRMPWLLAHLSHRKLMQWILISANPFAEHLWYLTAMLTCYIAFFLYIRWQKEHHQYHSLYLVGFFLYIVHVLLSSLLTAVRIEITSTLYRNALFFGFPMFALGLFIREYQERILEIYALSNGKLLWILAAGAAFSVLQWLGSGVVEMPLGTLFEVIALLLLLGSAPRCLSQNPFLARIISSFGELSTIIYVIHPFWIEVYDLSNVESFLICGETVMEYVEPILIVLASVFSGILWIFIKSLIHKLFLKCKARMLSSHSQS